MNFVHCRFCKSTNLGNYGNRYTKQGKKKRYKCKECNRTFTYDDGFLNMKTPRHIVVEALQLYLEGLSLSKVQYHIKAFHGFKIHRPSILYWMKKYSKLLKDFIKKQKPKIKGDVHVDEVFLKNREEWNYFWDAIDRDTKYVLATNWTQERDDKSAKQLMHDLKYCSDDTPPAIVTDGLWEYIRAVKFYFYHRCPHIRLVGLPDKLFNNPIERLQNSIKERYKVMRCFNSFESARAILDMWIVYYNFIRPHMSLGGKTPAEVAGLDLDLGQNKLMNLIFFFNIYSELSLT